MYDPRERGACGERRCVRTDRTGERGVALNTAERREIPQPYPVPDHVKIGLSVKMKHGGPNVPSGEPATLNRGRNSALT